MYRKAFLLMFVILLCCLNSSAWAKNYWWCDWGDGTHRWDDPGNWYPYDGNLPGPADTAIIGKGEAHLIYPLELHIFVEEGGIIIDPIIGATQDVLAGGVLCGGGLSYDPNILAGGEPDPIEEHDDPNYDHTLTITGGNLEITPVDEDVFWGGGLIVGQVPRGTGTMNMTGGEVYVDGWMVVGAWDGTGVLNMDGGVLTVAGALMSPGSPWGCWGEVNLNGGTVIAEYYAMVNDNRSEGVLNVRGGEMILDGDVVELLWYYAKWTSEGEDDQDGAIDVTAYDTESGEIGPDDMRAILVIDYDFRNAGKTTITAAKVDPNIAWDSRPFYGQLDVNGPDTDRARPTLSWQAGRDAVSHTLYLGTDYDEVDSTDTNSPLRRLFESPDTNYTAPEELVFLQTYYWRVDEVNGASTEKGDVWQFTVGNLGAAWQPSPADGEEEVFPLTLLEWTPGWDTSLKGKLYLSTDFNDVNDSNPGVAAGPWAHDFNSYDPPYPLERSTTYYWKVEQVDDGGIAQWPADVWSFTTAGYISVDEWEYLLDKDRKAVWTDGWVNDSGSELLLENEQVYSGETSVIFKYDTLYDEYEWYAEISAPTSALVIGADWDILGVEAFSVRFLGRPSNTFDRMYLRLEDSDGNDFEVEYDGDMNDLRSQDWNEWVIALDDFADAGVNLHDVSMVYMGFGDGIEETEGGDGHILVDAMRLYPRRCFPTRGPAGDFDGDCFVDYNDLAIMSEDWLIKDYNTMGYPGTLIDFPNDNSQWHPSDACGYIGGALEFAIGDPCNADGITLSEDCVEIPPLNLWSNTVSMTAWIKLQGDQYGFAGIIFCRDDPDGDEQYDAGETCAGLSLDNGYLRYHWNNRYWWYNCPLTVPENQWCFVGLAIDPEYAQLFKYDPSVDAWVKMNENWKRNDVEPFAGVAYVGQDSHRQIRHFRGMVDDVRIYDCTLDVFNMGYVAGLESQGEEPPSGPVVHYKFDESSGHTAEDSGRRDNIYWPVPSPANPYDEEPQLQRYVNLRDYAMFADTWLEVKLFP